MPQYHIGAQHQYRITHLHQINCGAVRIKMNFNEKLRSCDSFGVPVSLKLKGSTDFATTGGGLASISLKILIATFFCIKLIAVVAHDDPQISTYAVHRAKNDMTEPLALGDYSMDIFFSVTDADFIPILVDPSIGSIEMM